ncbi:MAG TPA: cyclase family protein [Steroidobacteraceae bacterium]|nr:cyclase family protein [Steroidobacteraceae bacterium]
MEKFRAIGERLSNWGRWGKDDERGTTNFITPERLVAAARLIRTGKVFDLGIPFGADGPQSGAGGRINPILLVSETGQDQEFPGAFHYADDYIFMPLQAASQWDSLAHVHYDGKLYNGFPASSIGPRGARHCGIDKQGKGIAGRGVLLDIPRHLDRKWLEMGEVITPEQLDACATAAGIEFRSGDILCIRTGWRRKFLEERNPTEWMKGEPGIGLASCEWLAKREIAVVCCDNIAVEALPGEVADEVLPVHMVLLRDMGMTLGEILDFEELAADCAADGVYEFFFCGPPIKFTRALGSPINPLAFK